MKFRPIYLSALLVTAALGAACDVRVGENGVSVDVAGGKASNEWTRTYTISSGPRTRTVVLNPVADTSALATLADGVVLCVRLGTTRREALALSRQNLDRVGARTLGTVVTMVPRREETRTASPSAIFNRPASAGLISMRASG